MEIKIKVRKYFTLHNSHASLKKKIIIRLIVNFVQKLEKQNKHDCQKAIKNALELSSVPAKF